MPEGAGSRGEWSKGAVGRVLKARNGVAKSVGADPTVAEAQHCCRSPRMVMSRPPVSCR